MEFIDFDEMDFAIFCSEPRFYTNKRKFKS